MKYLIRILILTWIVMSYPFDAPSQRKGDTELVHVALGWAKNSVNAVVFRKNSIVTHNGAQYTAFYDEEQHVTLAKRNVDEQKWKIVKTPYRGNAEDAHTAISIMIDGDGYLHVSWGHHNNPLHYAKSVAPETLTLGERLPMTGLKEDNVTYPEFYRLSTGDLLFFYRYGYSGSGDLVVNKYTLASKTWTQVQDNLIDGQGNRNAYWQVFVDREDVVHISWLWRETYDVATNHDICYARSKDGGETWEGNDGSNYALPITIDNAAVAWPVSQNSELINQTSMTADDQGRPIIATYWREPDTEIPQYHVVYYDSDWKVQQVTHRKTPFTLSGGGTKRIPIARPQVVTTQKSGKTQVFLVFRDEERGNKVSVAVSNDFPHSSWGIIDLTESGYGAWEPTYDTGLWEEKGKLHLFVQKVEQIDQEGLADKAPEMVNILEWNPPH